MSIYIRWSYDEFTSVARECLNLFGPIKIRSKHIYDAQKVLPADRHKHCRFSAALIVQIRQIADKLYASGWVKPDAPSEEIDLSRYEDTRQLRLDGSLPDERNGIAVMLPLNGKTTPAIVAPMPVPVIERQVKPLQPTAKLHVDTPCMKDVTNTLIEINRQVLRLKETDLQSLIHAGPLDALRIQSLVIQASNGLVFFEELCSMARRL